MRNTEWNRETKMFDVVEYTVGKWMEEVKTIIVSGGTKAEALVNLKKITGRK